MGLGGPVGALIGMWLADRIGRKPSMIIFSFAAICFGAIDPNLVDPAYVTLGGFALGASIYVLVGVAWSLYVPELFPTVIRMRGAGFCNTFGRMFTILTPQITTLLYGLAGLWTCRRDGGCELGRRLALVAGDRRAFFGYRNQAGSARNAGR